MRLPSSLVMSNTDDWPRHVNRWCRWCPHPVIGSRGSSIPDFRLALKLAVTLRADIRDIRSVSAAAFLVSRHAPVELPVNVAQVSYASF